MGAMYVAGGMDMAGRASLAGAGTSSRFLSEKRERADEANGRLSDISTGVIM